MRNCTYWENGKPQKSHYITDIIDIDKLERENRKVLFIGYIVAILLVCALEPFITLNKHKPSPDLRLQTARIRVRLVTVPRITDELPVQSEIQPPPDTSVSSIRIEKDVSDGAIKPEPQFTSVADTLKNTLPVADDRKMASILMQPPPMKEFPKLADKKSGLFSIRKDSTKIDYLTIPFTSPESGDARFDISDLHADIPITENMTTILGPGYGIVYWNPFPDDEEVEDERRKFKYDLLGIPIGGKGLAFGVGTGSIFLDVGSALNSGRHFLKSIVWKIEDMVKEGRILTMRNSEFSRVTEKDIRFMILLWKYDRVDPGRIPHKDRLFIAKAESSEIMPHFKYFDSMEKRGLASSLKKKGRLVYKANFTREEILHTLVYAYNAIKQPAAKNIVSDYIALIAE